MSSYTVFKYGLSIMPNEQVVQMPQGARILHVAQQPMQKSPMQVWAHVDKDAPLIGRKFAVYGTGHDVPAEPGKFLCTVMTNGGALVWHVYDLGELRQ